MSIVRDCGDCEVKIGFILGVDVSPQVAGPHSQAVRDLRAKLRDDMAKLTDALRVKREKMELELLDWLCDELGYDADTIKAKIESRTAEQEQAIVAERTGRAEKNRKRRGLR